MELARPTRLSDEHWDAVQQHVARVTNQLPGDNAGTIGACKELVECVAKIALEVAPAPEIADFPKLVKKACTVLGGAGPRTDGDAETSTLAKGMALLVQAAETAAQGVCELRNEHGSGHGHTRVPVIADEDVALVGAYANAWVTWALARLERLLANSVTALIDEFTNTTFYRGVLHQRLREVGFEEVGEQEQERLGFAVAERGGRRNTFVVAGEGLRPLLEDGTWPLMYQYGVEKGLLLTAHGTFWPIELDTLKAILIRLPEELQERLLDEVEGAPISQGISGDSAHMNTLGLALQAMLDGVQPALRDRWLKLSGRLLIAA